ncbi:hypothetical protein IFM89_005710 [Coptis chinensis]|uniref:Uncharacterized protein n=1 Tax=Coptis chinensis TaxID=261450 RepID=A0A835I9L0_9MAGN|nr:hypothetical protein IFM89_005710 [Coptis chinensis]
MVVRGEMDLAVLLWAGNVHNNVKKNSKSPTCIAENKTAIFRHLPMLNMYWKGTLLKCRIPLGVVRNCNRLVKISPFDVVRNCNRLVKIIGCSLMLFTFFIRDVKMFNVDGTRFVY